MDKLVAALFVLWASSKFPQDSSLEKFARKDPPVSFFLPSKQYELKPYAKPQKGEWWKQEGSLCEIRSLDTAEDIVKGVLIYDLLGWTNEESAKHIVQEWEKTCKNVTHQEKKLDRKGADWLLMEVTLQWKGRNYHYPCLFLQKGRRNLELRLWCPEAGWEGSRKQMMKVIDGVRYGE